MFILKKGFTTYTKQSQSHMLDKIHCHRGRGGRGRYCSSFNDYLRGIKDFTGTMTGMKQPQIKPLMTLLWKDCSAREPSHVTISTPS